MASRALETNFKSRRHEVAASGAAQTERAQDFSPEEIATRSYELWKERGCPTGSPKIDWFRAEEELRERYSNHQSAA